MSRPDAMSDRMPPLTVDFLAHRPIRQFMRRVPLKLDGADEQHVYVFRRLLEMAMTQGRWAGQMGPAS